jgi:hypothetical protein
MKLTHYRNAKGAVEKNKKRAVFFQLLYLIFST